MTTHAELFSAPHRRSRLSVARDLLVAGLCALIVAGFVLDVASGTGPGSARPSAASAELKS